MQQVIAVEVAGSGQRIDEGERRSRAVHHGDRRGAVEGDDGGRLKALQKSVEANDLGPVRILGLRRLTVQGGDRRLERERPGAAAQGLLDERQRLGDLVVIPAATVLRFENDEVAGLVEARVAPRVVQQHEGEEGPVASGGGGAISALTRRASRIASTQRSGLTSASPRVGR